MGGWLLDLGGILLTGCVGGAGEILFTRGYRVDEGELLGRKGGDYIVDQGGTFCL